MESRNCRSQHLARHCTRTNRLVVAGSLGLCAVGLLSLLALAALGGCTTDEVGHTKTTTKQTVDSPTQKSTVTETHTKDTTFTPR